MAQYTEITYSVDNSVATITLNRPDKLNAYTQTMRGEIQSALTAAISDERVRVLLITGAGRGFCAGADMKLLENTSGKSDLPAKPSEEEQAALFRMLISCPKPVVAAINGAAAGIGLVLTFYCDLRFVAAGAKLTTSFSQRGLIAEYGAAWLLPRLIGPMHALDLLLSARVLTSQEAASIGLARELPADNFRESVFAIAEHLAESVSPRSTRIIKEQILRSYSQTFDEALKLSINEMWESLRSADFKEGVMHYLEKRKPRFSGK